MKNIRPGLLVPLVLLFLSHANAQDEWPVRFEVDGRKYQMFAPQPENMSGNHFSARAAISMERDQDNSPIFGALWGDGVLELDRGSRLGKLISFNVTDVRFPGVENEQELTVLRSSLSSAIPQHAPPISIDWMVSVLEEEQLAGTQYANDPPEIIYRETPSSLIFIDGDPIYEQLDATVANQGDPLYQPKSRSQLERVVNTPFTIVRSQNGDHYLYGSGMWFRSRNLDGPWQREQSVPSELQQLTTQLDETAAITADDRPAGKTPEIIVRYNAAELLDLDGAPKLHPVQGTSLLTLTNTNRSVFMDINSQDYYFLASGRWFRTKDLSSGNWSYVPADQLPEEFKKIPEGSDRDMVLAHVAGTDAAREAAKDAAIPQTAQVDRQNASVEVTYQGPPTFDRITGTNIEYARNANTDVLRINGRYHVCDNGVWFEGPTPDGPWEVSTVVPEEVQTIPPSSPVYNVRYVYIYDHTPDIVYMGYTPGYLGSFVQHGVVIYGTGFYYRPWPGFWRPRPWTWGFNMFYDPWIGWNFGWGWGYNWFHPGWGMWGPNPYAWGWWGPYAWQPPCCASPHNTVYGHRPSLTGRSTTSRPVMSAEHGEARPTDLYSGRERAGIVPSTVDRAQQELVSAQADRVANKAETNKPPRQTTQDHFTDAAGNIYRQNGDRTQRYDNGNWSRIAPPARPERAPQRPPQSTPSQADRTPERTPDRSIDRGGNSGTQPRVTPPSRPQARPDPSKIQRDRQRGIQRQQNFRQRTPQQRLIPPTGRPSQRGGVSPGRSGGGSRGVSPGGGGGRPGGGGGSAPSRSGGGGRGR